MSNEKGGTQETLSAGAAVWQGDVRLQDGARLSQAGRAFIPGVGSH